MLEKLNESQQQAVTHENGPLLIVAGAGTGKTTVLTKRYVWLLQKEQLTTENILAVTFTEKASQEMEDRILQMLPNGTYDFWIHTFHGFCQRVLEEHALEIGLPNHFKLISESDAWIMLNRRFEELPLDHYRPLGNPVKFLQAILKHISRVKDEGISPDQYVEFAENVILNEDTEIATGERKRLKELADVYAAYQRILHDEGALDFGDLIVETLRLFKERPAVLQKYREQFKFLLIDEFQDTNWAQYELIKLLSAPKDNITVVGDDDQAIYKFRGASLANILQFKDDFKNTKTLTLTDNYRSRQEILDIAYTLIENNNPYRLEVSLADENLNKKLKAHKGDGAEVFVQWSHNIEKEAEWVATDIKANHGPNHAWSEFAILVRSNDEALPFVQSLERKGIPYKFFALRGLYTKPIIVDLISLLAVSDKPNDNPSLWRVLNLECLAIPIKALAEINKYTDRKGYTLWESLQNPQIFIKDPIILEKITHLVTVIEKLNETARRESPIGVLHAAIEESGYLNYIISQSENVKIEYIALLNEFVSRVRRYESSVSAPNHRQFMEELHMEIESGEQGALHADAESGPDVVRIMTIHASKGLEFETVYLVSMVDQRFPTRRRTDAIPLPDGLVNERLQEG
ncbi:ATP-dependent helicase, partial [Patescibacteria group bacterium]|nr:ATP-dependent helicase [Patescibacteria group bacterium]